MTRHRDVRRWLIGAALIAVAGCAAPDDAAVSDTLPVVSEQAALGDSLETIDAGADAGESADRNPTRASPGTSAPGDADLVVHTAATSNALIVSVSVSSDAASDVELTVEADGVEPRVLTSSNASTHDFTVVGLRASTGYTFAATSADASGSASFTTGAAPVGAPIVSVTTSTPSTASGITFFGLPSQGRSPAEFYGVDTDGELVWYLDTDEPGNRDPVIRDLGNGEILVFLAGSMQRMTLDGTVLQTSDLSSIDGWHHDALLLDGGGVLAMSRENRTVDGSDVRGDVIVELDAAGDVVWEWSSFDHLDTGRFPGALSRAQAQAGGTDWTHGNSIFVDESSGDVLLSLRSQHWIVSIDRATGSVNWIAGDDASTTPGFDAEFLSLETGSWTSGQHAATWTDDGELLVYDNRNETGGEANDSRIVIYDVDAAASTATQVFEAIAPKFTRSLGDVDELDNGNLLMTAGGPGSSATAHMVEVDRAGSTVWQATLDGRIYRSERISWSDLDEAAADS